MRLRLVAWVAVALLGSACEITNTNTNTGGNGGQGGQGGASGGGVVPTPTPTGGTSAGPRTPDPPAGSVLPLPAYGPAVLAAVPNRDQLVLTSCLSSAYLDALLAGLKARDLRWGRVCATPTCTTLRGDTIGYHATAGPDVTGATGAHVVDVIQNFCTGPVAQWLLIGYEPATALAF